LPGLEIATPDCCGDRRADRESTATGLREAGVWRVRVGDYRILYEVRDAHLVVLVIRIAKRSEAYR